MSSIQSSRRAPGFIRRLRMAPDTRSRHQQIRGLAGAPETLLDVGGEAGELALFMPGPRIVTANVEPGADVLFDGISLPFDAGSYDVTVSVDVIEHIERGLRSRHLAELARVARQKVIACCPLGGEAHEAAERELADWHEQVTAAATASSTSTWKTGCRPKVSSLQSLARHCPEFELLYGGDFREANAMFRLTTELKTAPTRPADSLVTWALRRTDTDQRLQRSPTAHSNRAFIVGAPTLGGNRLPSGAAHRARPQPTGVPASCTSS